MRYKYSKIYFNCFSIRKRTGSLIRRISKDSFSVLLILILGWFIKTQGPNQKSKIKIPLFFKWIAAVSNALNKSLFVV